MQQHRNDRRILDMNDLTEKRESIPEKLRNEHTPAEGDIYTYNSSQNEAIYRIRSIERNDRYTACHLERWCFRTSSWEKYNWSPSENELKKYYRLCLSPLEELLQEAERYISGQTQETKTENEDTTDLAIAGSKLPEMMQQAEMKEDRIQTILTVIHARLNEERELMEEKMKPLHELVKKTRKQLTRLERAMSIMEIYNGTGLTITAIREGEPADAAEPVTIRQRILFMDEECGVLDETGEGLDYWSRDRFYEWLKDRRHRDIILPEQRCVVVLKPRRYMRNYSSDPFTQALLNQWNRHSFILIRNGENISAVESEDLCIYGTAVPTRKNYDSIRKEYEHWQENAEQKLEDIKYRSLHFISVLQGLSDRTGIFAPNNGISFSEGRGYTVIFDDEQDTLLGNGRPDFPDWLREQSKTIRRGSRILYIPGLSQGHAHRQFGYDYNLRTYRGPAGPSKGIYTAEECSKGLSFTYLPKENIWNEQGLHSRTRRERWIFDPETVINYDEATYDTIHGYLQDRGQRRHYCTMIPALRKFESELLKEKEHEETFLASLTRVLDENGIPHTPETLEETVKWWKTKTIRTRAVSSDGDRAWRMILQHYKKQIQETTEKN